MRARKIVPGVIILSLAVVLFIFSNFLTMKIISMLAFNKGMKIKMVEESINLTGDYLREYQGVGGSVDVDESSIKKIATAIDVDAEFLGVNKGNIVIDLKKAAKVAGKDEGLRGWGIEDLLIPILGKELNYKLMYTIEDGTLKIDLGMGSDMVEYLLEEDTLDNLEVAGITFELKKGDIVINGASIVFLILKAIAAIFALIGFILILSGLLAKKKPAKEVFSEKTLKKDKYITEGGSISLDIAPTGVPVKDIDCRRSTEKTVVGGVSPSPERSRLKSTIKKTEGTETASVGTVTPAKKPGEENMMSAGDL